MNEARLGNTILIIIIVLVLLIHFLFLCIILREWRLGVFPTSPLSERPRTADPFSPSPATQAAQSAAWAAQQVQNQGGKSPVVFMNPSANSLEEIPEYADEIKEISTPPAQSLTEEKEPATEKSIDTQEEAAPPSETAPEIDFFEEDTAYFNQKKEKAPSEKPKSLRGRNAVVKQTTNPAPFLSEGRRGSRVTFAQLAEGFRQHQAQERQARMDMQGKEGGKLTSQQLAYEQFMSKIEQALYTSFVIHRPEYPKHTAVEHMAQITITFDKPRQPDISLSLSSGDRTIDAFTLRIFKHASSSFPDLPASLASLARSVRWVLYINSTQDRGLRVWRA